MVVVAFGLPGLTILELTHMLKHLNVTFGVVKQGNLETVKTEFNLPRTPVVFESGLAFHRFHTKFKKTKVTALVLGDPYSLGHEYNLPLLGATLNRTNVQFSAFSEAELKQALVADYGPVPAIEVTKVRYDPIPEVLKSYNASSLSSIQTQLYRIKDKETRDKVGKIVKNYFSSRDSSNTLRAKVQKVSNEKIANTFVNLVSTPEMKTLRVVVQKAKANPAKLKSYAKKMKISPFDIKYLLVSQS